MDNYSKNKINIPGFIVLLIWAATVIAVAHHNHPFNNQGTSDDNKNNKVIEIMSGEPLAVENNKEKPTPRFQFDSEINIITSPSKLKNTFNSFGEYFISTENKSLTLFNQNLEILKSFEFDHKIVGLLKSPPSFISVFTNTDMVYSVDISQLDRSFQRIAKLPYKVLKTYNIENLNLIYTDSKKLISAQNPQLSEGWSQTLDSQPDFISIKNNKLLVFTPEKTLHVLDATNGKELYRIDYLHEVKDVINASESWVVILNQDNSLNKLNLEDKSIAWQKQNDKITSLKLLKENNILLSIENETKLSAINIETGEDIWNRNLEHASFNFIFPLKVTAKEIKSFDLGWRHKGEIFLSSCSEIGLCFIDPKNGRVLKIIRSFNAFDISQYLQEPFFLDGQLTIIALGQPKSEE